MTCNSVHRHMHAVDFPAPCWDDGAETSSPASWSLPLCYVSRWQDQPGPAVEKRAFRVYLTCAADAEFFVGIRTERSLRRKNVLLRAGKRRCIHLPNHGLRWRLELACADPRAWQPTDGVSVYLDVDGEQ